MNLIKRTTDIQEKIKNCENLCTKSMESCPLVISHILANELSKSAQTFTVGFVKLLSTHPIHIVVWGNFPIKPTAVILSMC